MKHHQECVKFLITSWVLIWIHIKQGAYGRQLETDASQEKSQFLSFHADTTLKIYIQPDKDIFFEKYNVIVFGFQFTSVDSRIFTCTDIN